MRCYRCVSTIIASHRLQNAYTMVNCNVRLLLYCLEGHIVNEIGNVICKISIMLYVLLSVLPSLNKDIILSYLIG